MSLDGATRGWVERWLDIIHARVCDGATWAEVGREFDIGAPRARAVAMHVPREVRVRVPFPWDTAMHPGVDVRDLGRGILDPGNDPQQVGQQDATEYRRTT